MKTLLPFVVCLRPAAVGAIQRAASAQVHRRSDVGPDNPLQRRFLAFARLEFLAILAALGLLVVVVVPVFANPTPRTARIVCVNNLRQIGLAMQLWSNDRADRFPWEVPVAEGGTMNHPLAPNAWLHFAWISNELSTPKILLCPSDTGEPARDFTSSPDGGYIHPNFASRATSYFLSHGNVNRFNPADAFGGDRNFGADGSGGCARFGSVQLVSLNPPSSNYRWNTNLHNSAGNLVRLDGGVDQLSNKALRDAAVAQLPSEGRPSFHFVAPR